MATVAAVIGLSVHAREVLADGIKSGAISEKFLESLDLKNGTSNGQIDRCYSASVTTGAASTATDYDLAGTLTDTFGTTISFAEVVFIAVRNNRTTAGAYIEVGPDEAANGFGMSATEGPWAAKLDSGGGNLIGPGGWFVFYSVAGVAVVGGASNILTVRTSAVAGATNSWDIVVLGRSS